MSERMTDEEFEAKLQQYVYGSGARAFAANEARRARASEVAKDAQIKALADALWEQGVRPAGKDWHSQRCVDAGASQCTTDCLCAAVALRDAGRAP